MQCRHVFRRDRVIFDHCSKRYHWSIKGHSEPPFTRCLPIRQGILNISQKRDVERFGSIHDVLFFVYCAVLPFCAHLYQRVFTIHGIRLDHRKTFWEINFLYSIRPDVSVPVRIGTGDSGAREEDLRKSTIPVPTFARTPSPVSS